MQLSTLAATLMAVSAAQAAEHMVMVGQNNMNVFSPNSVMAAEGDTIRFHWGTGTHSVASGSFQMPCQPNNNFQSPRQMATSAQDWILQINSSDTTWVYCPVGDHCQEGMSMVINPPSDEDMSIMAYQNAAKMTQSQPGSQVKGGMLAMAMSGSSSSMMPSSSMMMPSGSSSAMPASNSNGANVAGLGAGALAAGAAGVAFLL